MKINWTPWNVAMHRRLEVIGAWVTMCVVLFLVPLSMTILFYLLVICFNLFISVYIYQFQTQYELFFVSQKLGNCPERLISTLVIYFGKQFAFYI